MDVISTLNLVSSENEKKTACNFQIMAVNSFVISHDLRRDQIGTYEYKQTSIYS